jgi:hypothetical protein
MDGTLSELFAFYQEMLEREEEHEQALLQKLAEQQRKLDLLMKSR